MSSKNASQLTPLTSAELAAADLFVVFDISAAGALRTKTMTRAEAEKAFARYLAPMAAAGDLVDDREYGYFKARVACKLVGVDFTLQDLPEGGDLIFDITKAGVELGKTTTIAPDDDRYGQTIFAAAVAIAVGDVLRVKITQAGATVPGAYLNANLILEPAVA